MSRPTTLRRQLFLGVSAVFLLVLTGIQALNVVNVRDYLMQQLSSHSQDAATSLGISLSTAMQSNDAVLARTVVRSMFDRGYFRSIRVVNNKGEEMVAFTQPPTPPEVPEWFAEVVSLQVPHAESMISSGWRKAGRVLVSSHPNFAYVQLWRTTVGAFSVLGTAYGISMLLLWAFLRDTLRPLKRVTEAAHEIGERNFVTIDDTPRAVEMRAVVAAINSLSTKVRDSIAAEVMRADRYRKEALQDELTGLDNRRLFEQSLPQLIDQAVQSPVGWLMMFELDRFKEYNQAQGFQRGDDLLRLVSELLREFAWENSIIRARINGGTFVVAGFGQPREVAVEQAQRLCREMSLRLAEQQIPDQFHTFCGMAVFQGNVKTGDILAKADMAVMQARRTSERLFVADCEGGNLDDKGSQYWKALIDGALNERRIMVHAQPVMGLKIRDVLQLEAMGRIVGPEGFPIPAGQFMPMAARHGMAARFDRTLLEAVFEYLNLREEMTTPIAINFSARTLQDQELLAWLQYKLADTPDLPPRLAFELAEFAAAEDLGAAEHFAGLLRTVGVELGIDHFGLHRSAFKCLNRLRPTYVKLHSSFTEGILEDTEKQFFISSVVKIADPMEIRVIATAIEDASVLPLLKDLGVFACQGYALARPETLFDAKPSAVAEDKSGA